MRILFYVFFLCTVFSCKDSVIGLCSSPFNISVSKAVVEGDLSVYYADVQKQEGWWLSSIAIDGKYITDEPKSKFTSDSFVYDSENIVFEKINNSKIKISIKKGKELAKVQIQLQSGNCFGSIAIN